MRIYIFVILCYIISFINSVEKTDIINSVEKSEVIILNDDNFDKYIKNNEYVLVKFYAPWCGHCKKLAPEYEMAAQILKEQGQINLAKIDCTVEKQVAITQGIEGYPTLKFFMKGRPIQYNGGRTKEEIIDWIKQITSYSSNIIQSIEQLNKFLSNNEYIVVYFGESEKNEKTFQIFEKAAKKLQKKDKIFFYTFNLEIAKQKQINKLPTIIVYQQQQLSQYNPSGPWNLNEIIKFIQDNLKSNVAIFDEITSEQIFLQQKPALILIYSGEQIANQKALNSIQQVRTEINQYILVCQADINQQYGELLADLIGLKENETPKFVIIEKNDEKIKKYWLNNQNISYNTLLQFVNDWKNNQLQESLKSQEIPLNNNDHIKVIVGKNYFDSVFNNNMDIIIEFYDESKISHDFSTIYEEIYLEFENQQIIFYKIDGNKNEIPGLQIDDFPTILIYNSNNKNNKLQYDKDLSKKSIIDFIKQNQSLKQLITDL